MPSKENVLILGDISSIPSECLKTVVTATQPQFINIYPKHSEGITDEELAVDTKKRLIAAGILTPPHLIICTDEEERATRIVGELPERRNGEHVYIVDQHPDELMNALKNNQDPKKEALRASTLLVVPASFHLDYQDPSTGIRVVSFPNTPYRFPTHPTPAS